MKSVYSFFSLLLLTCDLFAANTGEFLAYDGVVNSAVATNALRVTGGTNVAVKGNFTGHSGTFTNLTASVPVETDAGKKLVSGTVTGTGAFVKDQSPTIVTPTIASFANATHNHQNAAGGGALSGAAITSGTVADARIDAAIARLSGPTFTGDPKAPTATAGDNDTSIATTAFVTTAVGGASQTPWTQDIDADGNSLTNLDSMSGSGSGVMVIGNTSGINVTNDAVDANVTIGAPLSLLSNMFVASGWVLDIAGTDMTLTHSANLLTLAGGDFVVPTEVYGAGWDGDNSVPTKDALYDKIETIGGGTDADAIHDNVAGEIVVITEKTAVVGNDEILLEDSEDSNNKKSAKVTNLPVSAATTTQLNLKANLSGGNTLGGAQVLAEGASVQLDAAGSADGAFTGITRTGTAGATLAFGDLVYLDPTDSRWELVDANAASAADGDARGILGICVQAAAADGNATTILLNGIVRADAVFPAFTINAPIYASETAGDLTNTSPTTEDAVVRIVGAALTADEIYFNPSYTWVIYDAP